MCAQVHDDVRLRQNALVEKDESHAGKIVERHWCARALLSTTDPFARARVGLGFVPVV